MDHINIVTSELETFCTTQLGENVMEDVADKGIIGYLLLLLILHLYISP